MMEACAFKQIMPKLRQTNKIKSIVKDGDAYIEYLIKNFHWNVGVIHDAGHAFKNFNTSFKKYNKMSGNKLTGLKNKIQKFLKNLLDENTDSKEKLAKWSNSYNHLRGDHSKCTHDKNKKFRNWGNSKNKKACSCLKTLLNSWKPFISIFKRNQNTCYNENYHSIKSEFCQKTSFMGDSILVRLSASILEYNKEKWLPKFADYLGLSMTSKVCVNTLQKYRDHQKTQNQTKIKNRKPEIIRKNRQNEKKLESKHLRGYHK